MLKNLPVSAGDTRDVGSIPGSGRSPGGGNGNPLQYSHREKFMDRGAWPAIVHGVAKCQTQLSMHTHMVFPVVMYRCESWTIKKTESQRTDAFKLRSWRRLSRLPRTAMKSNQLILKEINPEYSLEGLMPKLKLQYFGHLMGRADSLEKTLMLEKIKGRRGRGGQRTK